MSLDFITLNKVGVGTILVRYSEIVEMEPTPCDYTRIDLSTGNYLIVEEGPLVILKLINKAEQLKKLEESNK